MSNRDVVESNVLALADSPYDAGTSDDTPGDGAGTPDRVANRNDVRRLPGSVDERRGTDYGVPDAPPSGRKDGVDRLEELGTHATPDDPGPRDTGASNRRKREQRRERRAKGGQTTGDKVREAAKDDDGDYPGEKEPAVDTNVNVSAVAGALSILEDAAELL